MTRPMQVGDVQVNQAPGVHPEVFGPHLPVQYTMIDGVIQKEDAMAKKTPAKEGKAKPRSPKAAVQVNPPVPVVEETPAVSSESTEDVVTQIPVQPAPLVTKTHVVAGAVRPAGSFQERLVAEGLIEKLGRVERIVSATVEHVDMEAVREHSDKLAKMVVEALSDGHLQPFELLALGVAFAKAVRAAHKE